LLPSISSSPTGFAGRGKKNTFVVLTDLMKRIILLCVSLGTFSAYAQNVDKLIQQANVARILKTLSSDQMAGRPSLDPSKMERATSFIEGEFKTIGLSTLTGLSTFRQEFTKTKVTYEKVQLTLDGNTMPEDKAIILSEKKTIDVSTGFRVKYLWYDSTASNLDEYFLSRLFPFLQDTTSALMVIDSRFKKQLNSTREYLSNRFANNRKYVKILVIHHSPVNSFSVKASQKILEIKMANVVGVIKGKSKPDEFVVFSGHYDHLGISTPVNGDSISNGADDDASGTTAVIELARYFKKSKDNERTLVFVAFTAEEIGGYGSQYFSQQLNPDKVVAMFNIEMIGKPSKWGQNAAFITGYERSDFGSILEKNLSGTKFSFKPDPYPEQNLFYRSDNATLARQGVPAHTISTDQIDSDKLYHTVDDEFESLDISNVTSTIRAIALSAKSIVNGKDTPKRIDKGSVK
jgi:hypothetical protein